MNADYFIKEGFTPKLVIDIGWPFTSEKGCCACAICGGAMFYEINEPRGEDEILVPVHKHCEGEAKEKYLDEPSKTH